MLATLDAEPQTFAAGISAFCPMPLTQKVWLPQRSSFEVVGLSSNRCVAQPHSNAIAVVKVRKNFMFVLIIFLKCQNLCDTLYRCLHYRS